MRYSGRHQIQILDDSTDETSQVIDSEVNSLKSKGIDIEVVRRTDRQGYKAGALAYAHPSVKVIYCYV